uniref:Protein UBASH3A n=1 Tax=Ascaris suum TaxID=6253 RepID=F1KX03_ASCSU
MWRKIKRLFSRARTGRGHWARESSSRRSISSLKHSSGRSVSNGRSSSARKSSKEDERSEKASYVQGSEQEVRSFERKGASSQKEPWRHEKKADSSEDRSQRSSKAAVSTCQNNTHTAVTTHLIPIPVVTRSFWCQAVRDPEDLSRLVLVMRAGERIDRVVGNEWIHVQSKGCDKFTPVDGNLPTRVHWHKDAQLEEDSPLTTLGRHSAVLLARALYKREIRPALIVSSPALRAIQTADAIAKFLHTTFAVEEGLCEPGCWYTQCGKFALPRFLKTNEMRSCNFSINLNYTPVMPSCLDKVETERDEAQGYDRIEDLLLDLCARPRAGPLLVVGHAVTVHTAALICDAFSSVLNSTFALKEEEGSEERRKQVQRCLPPVELGARYPYACVLAMALNEDIGQYEYIPSLLPPLSFGDNYSNRIVLTI